MRDFQTPGRSPVLSERGMCATSHPLAASAAIDILRNGGNAVDAAIAGAVLLGICEPQMTGIGGDCFVLVSPPDGGDVLALNGSGRAPAAASAQALRGRGLDSVPLFSPEAVTIPGAIAGFAELSQRLGRLGLAASLAPAIDYAERGVPVAPRVAHDWQAAVGNLQGAGREHYLLSGNAPGVGQVFRSPGQATVLRAIAEAGPQAFYTGEIAADMVAALNELGGVHTEEDFANHRADWATPISGSYGDIEVVEHPPNGQGATAILLLNILKAFDISAMDPHGAERAHIEAEAAKLAYDARNRFIADPEFMSNPDRLLDPDLARDLAALIDPGKAMEAAPPLTEAVHRDTIYITVVDEDRMAVSLIYSIFHSFGSGIASPTYGILLQNRGAGFTLAEGHPNEYGPGKRPLHTIIPGMLRQGGKVLMPFGVMGGQYQPNGHARFVSNVVDFGMDPQHAIDSPRSFAFDGVLSLESGYGPDVQAQLSGLGHRVVRPDTGIGGAQAIRIDPTTGVLIAGSDPRKDGQAVGY
ncbi:gamma-glutamyltransferase 2 [Aliiruegeria haliotis]|uniref:Gamma-glutamyltransferase 2 n=1 Tax=Aliiruegeria haliotis TaxID=1280846 RepID=A0A2T0RIA1_9RHOB|nr:gamma-glutamyltransferase family protein [Aliiruegeria haliotis]PRY20905.1 gamma-glutamyltransferase 2 [Aliiruegeria haliotis]